MENRFDGADEHEDEEDNVFQQLSHFAHKVQRGPKVSQSSSKNAAAAAAKGGPAPLTRAQIAAIVHAINTGSITLPELPDMSDKDLVAIWALVDAGSAVHVVDFEKVFPGLKVREYKAQRHGVKYTAAGGTQIENRGEGTVHFKTVSGQDDSIVFQNAKVGIPIMSTNGLAREGKDLTYREFDGYIYNHETKESEPFIARDGVYFRQMLVPRSAVQRHGNRHVHQGLQH